MTMASTNENRAAVMAQQLQSALDALRKPVLHDTTGTGYQTARLMAYAQIESVIEDLQTRGMEPAEQPLGLDDEVLIKAFQSDLRNGADSEALQKMRFRPATRAAAAEAMRRFTAERDAERSWALMVVLGSIDADEIVRIGRKLSLTDIARLDNVVKSYSADLVSPLRASIEAEYEYPVAGIGPKELPRRMAAAFALVAKSFPANSGIALFVFDFNRGENDAGGLAYAASARRLDVVAMLGEWITRETERAR